MDVTTRSFLIFNKEVKVLAASISSLMVAAVESSMDSTRGVD